MAAATTTYPPMKAGAVAARPVINVSWDDAKAYVAWLSKKTGKSYRLLSGSEYEYATRAGTHTVYPWGNAVGTNNANCHACGSQWDARQTAPVGSFAAEQVRSLRYGRQCPGVDGGLLPRHLQRRADGRLGLDRGRRLLSPCRARRVLAPRSCLPPLGEPLLVHVRLPAQLPWFPGRSDACTLNLWVTAPE